MGLLNFILNLAGLLLWIHWSSSDPERFNPQPGSSLLSALKPTRKSSVNRWVALAVLTVILLLRAVIYWHLGSTANWSGRLDFHAVILSFRGDLLGRMMVFSLLSFGFFLANFYLFLIFLAFVHRDGAANDPAQRVLRSYLGPIVRWPRLFQIALPVVVFTLAWALCNPLAIKWGLAPKPLSPAHLWEQATLIGFASLLGLEYAVVATLLLYLTHSYVFLGNLPFWSFVNSTGQHLLRPLARLPLRAGRVDFAPIVAVALVFLIAESAENVLPKFFQRLPL